jgi:hypothetical protein
MRILIQSSRGAEYYLSPGRWSSRPEDATDFESTIAALDAIHSEDLSHTQIVFHFDGARQDVTLHLSEPGEPEKIGF